MTTLRKQQLCSGPVLSSEQFASGGQRQEIYVGFRTVLPRGYAPDGTCKA